MIDRLVALIVDEGKWLPASMTLAVVSTSLMLFRHRHSELAARHRFAAAMNLFFAVTIGTMALGHLLAVTTRLAVGTLAGRPLVLYPIGGLLAAPSWLLVHHSRSLFAGAVDRGRKTIALNAWLAATLVVLGIHNVPLAAPGLFNIAHQLHTRGIVGWAIAAAAVFFNVGLFIGSLIFLASGQSFEQFSGMQ